MLVAYSLQYYKHKYETSASRLLADFADGCGNHWIANAAVITVYDSKYTTVYVSESAQTLLAKLVYTDSVVYLP